MKRAKNNSFMIKRFKITIKLIKNSKYINVNIYFIFIFYIEEIPDEIYENNK